MDHVTFLLKNRHTKILHNRITAAPEDTVKNRYGSINHTLHVQKLLSADTLFNTLMLNISAKLQWANTLENKNHNQFLIVQPAIVQSAQTAVGKKEKKISTLKIPVSMQLHHALPAALLLQAVLLPALKC